jgi:hypothetical protein
MPMFVPTVVAATDAMTPFMCIRVLLQTLQLHFPSQIRTAVVKQGTRIAGSVGQYRGKTQSLWGHCRLSEQMPPSKNNECINAGQQ